MTLEFKHRLKKLSSSVLCLFLFALRLVESRIDTEATFTIMMSVG